MKASFVPSGDHVPAEFRKRSALKCRVVPEDSSSATTSPVRASATKRLKRKSSREEMKATYRPSGLRVGAMFVRPASMFSARTRVPAESGEVRPVISGA